MSGALWHRANRPQRAERNAEPLQLQENERRVLNAIRSGCSSISEISAETLLSPDIVVRAVVLLTQRRLIHLLENQPALELEAVG